MPASCWTRRGLCLVLLGQCQGKGNSELVIFLSSLDPAVFPASPGLPHRPAGCCPSPSLSSLFIVLFKDFYFEAYARVKTRVTCFPLSLSTGLEWQPSLHGAVDAQLSPVSLPLEPPLLEGGPGSPHSSCRLGVVCRVTIHHLSPPPNFSAHRMSVELLERHLTCLTPCTPSPHTLISLPCSDASAALSLSPRVWSGVVAASITAQGQAKHQAASWHLCPCSPIQ